MSDAAVGTDLARAYLTAALYRFVELDDYVEVRERVLAECRQAGVKGTLLLASEGINGTIAGPESAVRQVLAFLRADPRLAELEHKESWSATPPFHRLKVRLKKEIVALGVPGISPTKTAGTYVSAQDWNALLHDPEVIVIDTRNDYESQIGTFPGALTPDTTSFSQLPDWLTEREAEWLGEAGQKPKVAMFCTGGIRCEKSTALLRERGYDEVFHLQGGILKYLAEVAPEDSLWEGECFVFDERVSVGLGLEPGGFTLCRSCRRPLSPEDRQRPEFEAGVSCHRCLPMTDKPRAARLRERQRQVELAQSRGERHVGDTTRALAEVALPELVSPVDRLTWWLSQAPARERILLALVGMPGAGKSTLAERWASAFGPEVVALSMDGFHLTRAELDQLPDPQLAHRRRGAPWTFAATACASTLGAVKSGAVVAWPGFDHSVGDPVADAVVVSAQTRVVIVEGNYLLHDGDGWAARELFTEAWYVDVPTELARERTVARHQTANGNTEAEARQRWRRNDKLNASIARHTAKYAQWRVANP